ncbi:MAG: hypothetical protein IPK83_12945 [Planctomycetes bacterium]|nr:hypothetical protein [Planctomycetota bacterium]
MVCGTSGFFSGSNNFDRDFDWYELNVNAQTDILWEVVAEFTATISIIDASAGCPGTVLDSATVPPCVQHAVYWFADQPGTYWLVIGSDGFNDVDSCPAKYTVSVPTPFGCPPGDVNQDQVRDGRDVQGFVDCIVLGSTLGGSCPCADVTGDGVPTLADISPFVSGLLGN